MSPASFLKEPLPKPDVNTPTVDRLKAPNSLKHIVILHGMNACRLVDAIAKADPLRKKLIDAAMATKPKCQVGDCKKVLDPNSPSGWIVEWHARLGNHVRQWCCDDHAESLTQQNQDIRSGLSEPVSNLDKPVAKKKTRKQS